MRRVTVTTYNVRASKNQVARWGFWARRLGFSTVGPWLQFLATREVLRHEIARGVWDDPTFSDDIFLL